VYKAHCLFQCKSTNHGKSLHYDIIFIVSVRRGFFFMLLYTILYFSAYEQLIPDNAMHVLQFSISSLHFVGRKICRVICISWIINYVHPYLISFFFVTRDVRASLHASQLIPRTQVIETRKPCLCRWARSLGSIWYLFNGYITWIHGCMHADYVKVKFIYRYKAEISLLC
jgi:hypothetical protein